MEWKIVAIGDVDRREAHMAAEVLGKLGFAVELSSVAFLRSLLGELTVASPAEAVVVTALHDWAGSRIVSDLMQMSFDEFWAQRPVDVHPLLAVLANNGQVFADGANPAMMREDDLGSIALPTHGLRIRNRLRSADIITVHMIRHLSDKHLLDITGLGPLGVRMLRHALH